MIYGAPKLCTVIIIIFHSQDLLSRNVLSNVSAPKAVSSHTAIDRWSDCIGPYRDSCHLHTQWKFIMKPSDPLLLADVTLCCGIQSCMCFKKLFLLNWKQKIPHIFWTKPENSDQSDTTACLTVECAATRNMAHLTSTVFLLSKNTYAY